MAFNQSNDDEDPLYNSPDMQMPETKDWDAFKDPPRKLDQGSEADSKWMDIVITTSKIVTYIVVFCLILGTAILSKGTLLFMTSQIKKNLTRPFCNKKHDINQQFIVTIPEVERTAWIWMLVFAYFVPEVGTFIRSVRILSFKSWTKPSIWEFISVALSETLTAIGSAILVFVILPDLDVVKGAMLTNAVCFIPAVLGLLTTKPGTLDSAMKITLDALSCLAQLTALIVWPVIEKRSSLYMIPVSVLLISAGWWENYVSSESSIPFIRQLGIKKRIFENGRYFIYAFVSIWKCVVFFVTLLIILMVNEDGYHFIFSNMADAFSEHKINITSVKPVIDLNTATINYSEAIAAGTDLPITTNQYAPIYVWVVNIIATYFCYGIAKFSYKVIIQGFSFAFPINLAVPVLLSALIAMCGAFVKDECAYFGTIPSYLFFNSPPLYLLRDFISQQCSWIWLIWLLSQAWITVHIWSPSCEKLASTEKLFVKPLYDAFLIDQSLALNKRREEVPTIAALNSGDINTNNTDYITKIYACGTMWHETKEEMMEFLKSIMRLDADQCANRIVRTHFNMNLPSYYELETHVFFDDAYIRTSQDDPDPHVNQFVLDLVSIIDEAASQVHQTTIKVRPPVIYSTPYGGRLIWTLPGKTKMIAHLKDKKKIRAKKRWSQVMYMYYLLGYKLMADESISEESKNIKAENTYILALDGDIDFQPQAVQLLVDYMKKNKSLGAACGRIHPIGSGAMAWYQMFEYAVGHWMQKATEHVFGCVLCSPGCFSLFRGKALMDDCVMNKYTTKASEAVHYVQYDQGEDRWLCTLLLQRGYRVEYSAASDAYTHCPEGFNEFYNQRRRWMPSTTANILDLLMDYKHTVKINDNISMLYIGYQGLLMIGTALGPGTIFLMLVGAFVAAFQLDQWTSFIWNIVPILIFVIVCATCKSDTQLFFAGIISAVYGLIMMAVLVGVLLEINNDGILAPSSLFFFCIAGEFIIAGLLHPKEFNCLKYGIIYYVTVPSMYMLLVIYSVFNMNNVSWGTREVTIIQKPKATNEKEAEKVEEPKKKENKVLSFLGANKKDNEGSIEFSISSMFRCMLCTHQKHSDELDKLHDLKESLNSLNKKLDVIEMNVYRRIDLLDRANNSGETEFIRNNSELRRNTSFSRKGTTHVEGARASRVHFDRQVSQMRLSVSGDIEEEEISDSNSQPSDEVTENSWFYDGDLIRGEVDFIPKREELFWNGLLDKYLHPIDDTENKDRIAKELKDLRDKMVFTFFMINALFVLVVFLLTLKKDLLHINWPVAPKTNFTYVPDENEVLMYRKYLQLEPIGFVFLIFFALLLVIQFMGMIVHRFATFSQIIVNTRIDWEFFQKNVENMSGEEVLEQDPLKIAKALAKLKGLTSSEPEKLEPVARRNTVLLRAQSIKAPQRPINDLEKAFERRLTQFENNSNAELPIRRDTMAAVRRKTMEIKPRQVFSYSPGEADS